MEEKPDLKNFKGVHMLPKGVMNDGSKWLLVRAKATLDGMLLWPEKQSILTVIIHVLLMIGYFLIFWGGYNHVTDKDTGMGEATYAISIQCVVMETAVRRTLCYYYRKRLTKILGEVYFDFWPSNILGPKVHKEITEDSRFVFNWTAMYTLSGFICCSLYIILPLYREQTPIHTTYPFPWKESPYYGLLYVHQSFVAMEIVFNICGLDYLFVSIAANCIAQFKLLRYYLIQELDKITKKSQAGSVFDKMEAKKLLVRCIERHNKLIRTCEEVDGVFSYFVLVQCLTAAATICMAAFVITYLPAEMGSSLGYLFGHLGQMGIYCYMGNELSLESVELSNSLYQAGWHKVTGDRDIQKSILMIMVRAQRPVRLSAGGFGYLSLSGFMSLLRFSFSVYTLLRSVMRKQNNAAA